MPTYIEVCIYCVVKRYFDLATLKFTFSRFWGIKGQKVEIVNATHRLSWTPLLPSISLRLEEINRRRIKQRSTCDKSRRHNTEWNNTNSAIHRKLSLSFLWLQQFLNWNPLNRNYFGDWENIRTPHMYDMEHNFPLGCRIWRIRTICSTCLSISIFSQKKPVL